MTSWLKKTLFSILMVNACAVHAGVVVGGTRVVYAADNKEVSLSVRNTDDKVPFVIQSWIENEQSTELKKVPFIITPPLFRLDPEQENMLRIVYTGDQLPSDRESVFWLNSKAIPASNKSAGNQLYISINTRIKLFYRPAALVADAAVAYKKVTFSAEQDKLIAHNSTPYYVSFANITVGGATIKSPGMVAPMSTQTWALPTGQRNNEVVWDAINDFGGITPQEKGQL